MIAGGATHSSARNTAPDPDPLSDNPNASTNSTPAASTARPVITVASTPASTGP